MSSFFSFNQINLELGKNKILSDISLEMIPGKVYGFIGDNGSGKSMLFRVASGLLKPTSGEVVINDKTLYKEIDALPSSGVLIENVGLYPDQSVMDNLISLAKIRNLVSKEEIASTIKRVGLDPYSKKTFNKLSLGMKKRALIAQAIMEKPDILILDEASAALDKKGHELFRDIVKDEVKRGACILISSHDEKDISLLCDEIYEFVDKSIVQIEK